MSKLTRILVMVVLFPVLGACTGVVDSQGAGVSNPPARALQVLPVTASVPVGGTQSFVASETGGVVDAGPATVTWSVVENGGGTVDSLGNYTAPTVPGTYHVRATSSVDQSEQGQASVTVTPSAITVSISPDSAPTSTGGSLSFQAMVNGTVAGQSTEVTWSVAETGGGTVDASGHYVAPASTGTFHVMATSVADPSVQAVATVTVTATPVVSVSIAPASASTTSGGTLQFTATVSGTIGGQSTAVTWSVQESGGGTVNSSGRYTAPVGTGTFHVIATSVADPSKKASAQVTVTTAPVVAVSVSPDTASTRVGGALSFTAIVTGTTAGQSTAVTWSVQEAGGGTVNGSGRYTAPGSPGTFHVVATSVADPTKKDSATVTVSPDIAVAIAPRTASTPVRGTLQFTATVTGTLAGQSTAVTWSVQEATGGSVSASGAYTAPSSPGTFHVVATSAADPTKQDMATVTVNPNITVSVSPGSASTQAGGSLTFTAVVSGAGSGQSTAVTWSVQESGGGSVDSSGHYTAPGSAGTFHVVATSIADSTKSGTATVSVTAPSISVSISPQVASTTPNGTLTFVATVSGLSGSQSSAVQWTVQEGSAGGAVDGSGHYTAPGSTGSFHVVATSVADPSKAATASVTVASSTGLLPTDRMTVWNPGVSGGIPGRSTVCATVNAGSYGNGSSDATAGIQAAIDGCPAGQVVQLSAGTFTIGTTGNFILVNKGITLRGAGPGQTTLQKTNGATPGSYQPGPHPSPIVIVGPARWDNGKGTSTNLTADAAKGAYSITVGSTAGLSAGQFVLLDELSNASWQTDPGGRGQIWASPDFRVVWQRHNPSQGTDDPFPAAAGWFSRQDRPTNEIKQIDHVSGNTVFFTTPIHISYRAAQTAQLTSFGYTFVQSAGIEDFKVTGGDDGNIRFQWAANSWAKSIDDTAWLNEGFALAATFHVEVRDSYVHDADWPVPGGGGYAISLSSGTSEALVENCIIVKANKVMVARSAGTASVFGYNYADDGYILGNTGWIEIGLNASHMVGPHHVLFEGNYGFNFDSDKTHGNAIYHTVFRNHLRGIRRDFGDASGNSGPKRCAGLAFYSYWHSFVGNVLGASGQMSGWVYQSGKMTQPAIFLLGWDDWAPYPVDPQVAATTIRHGNFDYLTSSVTWDPSIGTQTLPSSLYLSGKPAFFNSGSGYTWPWVDPTGSTKLYTLPAKARFDNGTPFSQP